VTAPLRIRGESPTTRLFDIDWALVVSVLVLGLTGLVAIFSATRGDAQDSSFALRQALYFGPGVAVMLGVAFVDYRRLWAWAAALVVLVVVPMVLVLGPLGTTVSGSSRWIHVGGVSVQPSEFAKLGLIVALAALFSGRGAGSSGWRILGALGVAGLLSVLVLAQPDIGSVLVYGTITLGVMAVAGVPRVVLGGLVAAALVAAGLTLSFGLLEDYQQQRLTSFLDVEADPGGAGYNQRQSITAIGSGGLTGKGLFQGPQTQLQYVPEQHTDFIFTVVGEELGFVGAGLVLGAYSMLVFRVFRAAQTARDDFGGLLCVGVFTMFVFHLFQNVGMNLGIMPITGIPLKFLSYGGSSLLTSCLALGMVLSVSAHRYRGSSA
jgi:rod shape determining protein RodA